MRLILSFVMPAALCACASTTPQWDERFGDSVRVLRAQQLRNPAAVANADPASGVDGRAARAALDNYERSFAAPAASAPAAAAGGVGR